MVIVSDAVDFCPLVANRADPAGLDVHITGNAELAAAVLAAAAVPRSTEPPWPVPWPGHGPRP